MAEPRRTQAGFTLAEMLAALGILLFGVTSLLAAMASSIGQRRSADARLETTALVEHVVHRAMHECIALRDGSSSPVDLEFRPLVDQPWPGFPGLRWSVRATVDENHPTVWLLRIEAKWFDGGEEIVSEYLRVVPRQAPLRDRVLTARGGASETTDR
jgi:hypothetical protein